MHKKPRKPNELFVYEALVGRLDFSSNQEATYRRLTRGFEGERKFFEMLPKSLVDKHHIYFDLSLMIDNSETQIDVLIPTQQQIHHLEIKHYKNSFTVKGDQWQLENGKVIMNPLHQLRRTGELINILTQKLGHQQLVTSHIIFTHPTFHLYQASKTWPIIYPNQIQKFIKKIQAESKIQNKNLNHYIQAHHLKRSRFERIPNYNFDQLRKGLFCPTCHIKLKRKTARKNVCPSCGHSSNIAENVIRATEQYQHLFPKKQINIRTILAWTDYPLHRTQIYRIFNKNYQLIKKNRGSYYLIE